MESSIFTEITVAVIEIVYVENNIIKIENPKCFKEKQLKVKHIVCIVYMQVILYVYHHTYSNHEFLFLLQSSTHKHSTHRIRHNISDRLRINVQSRIERFDMYLHFVSLLYIIRPILLIDQMKR